MNKPFGWELLVDAYGCNREVVDDISIVYDFLEEAVRTLGVSKQSPPFVFHSPNEFPDKAGISAWVPLIESGIQCHTLTEKNFVSIDYYTCSLLDEKAIKSLLALTKKISSPKVVDYQLVARGEDYYR